MLDSPHRAFLTLKLSSLTAHLKPSQPRHLVPPPVLISLHITHRRDGLNVGAIDPPATTSTTATADDLWVPAESLSRSQEEVVLTYFDEGKREDELDPVVAPSLAPVVPCCLCHAAGNTARVRR